MSGKIFRSRSGRTDHAYWKPRDFFKWKIVAKPRQIFSFFLSRSKTTIMLHRCCGNNQKHGLFSFYTESFSKYPRIYFEKQLVWQQYKIQKNIYSAIGLYSDWKLWSFRTVVQTYIINWAMSHENRSIVSIINTQSIYQVLVCHLVL